MRTTKASERSESLIGRGREIELITDQLALAKSGQSRVIFLSGEPGIGKTRLLDSLELKAAQQEIIVLRSGATEAEGMPSYLLFLEALGKYIQDTPAESLHEQAGVFAGVLGTIFPELIVRLGEFPTSYPLPPEQARLRLYEAISAFLAAVAAPRGLLLIFDDLQWADKGSLDLLYFLVRHQPVAKILILGAYREGESTAALKYTMAELNRLRKLNTISIAALSDDEMIAISSHFLGTSLDPTLAQLLVTHSEGNPFFAEELLRGWLETDTIISSEGHWRLSASTGLALPSSIVVAVRQRLARVAPETLDYLHTAAIIGRIFDIALLAEVIGHDAELIEERLHQAEQSRLIHAKTSEIYTFSHDKIRECLYEDLSSTKRRRLHERIGRALEARFEIPSAQRLVELAFHFTRSGDQERGTTYALKAAEVALRACAPEEAITHYRAALDLISPSDLRHGQLLLKLGEAAVLAGHEQVGISTFAEAEDWFVEAGDKSNAARAAQGRGRALWRRESLLEAKAAFERALDLLGGSSIADTVHVLVDLGTLLAVSLFRPGEGYAYADRALQIAQNLEDDLLMAKASRTVGNLLVRENRLREGIALLERALELATQIDDPVEAVECCAVLGIACYWRAEINRAFDILQLQLGFAERCHDPFQLRHVYTNMAVCYEIWGQFAESAKMFAKAQTLVESLNNPEALAYHQLSTGWLAHLRGDNSTAEQLVSEGLEVLRQIGTNTVTWYLGWLGLIQLSQGKQQKALYCAVELEVLIASLPEESLSTAEPLHHLIMLALSLDDNVRLSRYADRLEAFSGQAHDVLTDRLRGIIATRRGDWEQANTLLTSAETVARRENARVELVEIWIAQGELALAQHGHLSELAAELFERALVLSQQMSYSLGVQHVEMLRNYSLTKSGSPGGLSRREVDVLQLVAEGKTNHQIAEALFISDKTVEKHLTSIFTKTGTDNRAGATSFAYQHRIISPK